MIHYHGTPITPDTAAVEILRGRHAIVSFAHSSQITLVAKACQSYVIDNGAFSFWKSRKPVNWDKYYQFINDWRYHPGFEWALIPDKIEGSGKDNDTLLADWPFGIIGVPVWHLHEDINRLVSLAIEWPRIALGSSGEFATVNTSSWWARMSDALNAICDSQGQPCTKLHGLRMLNPKVFSKLPLSSADSTNIARNIGIDKHWRRGSYLPPTKAARGILIATRIEAEQSAPRWSNF